jgi:hypothetical protein
VTPEQAQGFITALGGKQLKTKPGWVTSSCVLAPFTHKNGHDSNPSFGLTVKDGERSNFNCFSCTSGSAEELLQSLQLYDQQQPGKITANFKLAREILNDEDLSLAPLPAYQEFGNAPAKVFEEWPWWFINGYSPAWEDLEARSYLQGRQVTEQETGFNWLRFDHKKRMIVMPYTNVYGRLAGARGRSIDDHVKGWKKHYDYTWNEINNASLVWYNEQCLQLDGPVVVVEGQFDALRVAKTWPKVVANMTAKPVLSKMGRLLYSPLVIHIPDTDETGIKSIQIYQDFCHQNGVEYRAIKLPSTVKDAGDCHPDFLLERIQEIL